MSTAPTTRLFFLVPFALLPLLPMSFAGCGGKEVKAPVVEPIDAGPPEPVDAGPPPPKTLIEKVGGAEKLTAMVDAVVKAASENAKLKKAFPKAGGPKVDAFKKNLGDFLCEHMKGTCKYESTEARTAYKGMVASEPQWEAFVEVLMKGLTDAGLGDAERDEVLDFLTPLHDDMLNKKK